MTYFVLDASSQQRNTLFAKLTSFYQVRSAVPQFIAGVVVLSKLPITDSPSSGRKYDDSMTDSPASIPAPKVQTRAAVPVRLKAEDLFCRNRSSLRRTTRAEVEGCKRLVLESNPTPLLVTSRLGLWSGCRFRRGEARPTASVRFSKSSVNILYDPRRKLGAVVKLCSRRKSIKRYWSDETGIMEENSMITRTITDGTVAILPPS